jgi:hypothetical protein
MGADDFDPEVNTVTAWDCTPELEHCSRPVKTLPPTQVLFRPEWAVRMSEEFVLIGLRDVMTIG